MIEDIIARAHQREHPSRYANESGISKISFVLFALVAPFVGHSASVRVYSFSSDLSTSNSVLVSQLDEKNLAYPFYNIPFGFVVRGFGSGLNGKSIVVPSRTDSVVTNRNGDISHPLTVTVWGNPIVSSVWESISFSSEVESVFDFALSVVVSGYSGIGVEDLGGNAINHYFNFDYKKVVADLLSSTNTTYRALVLSHLSNISASVVNIDTGVSELRPVLSDIKDINTSISSNSVEQSSLLRGINTNSFLAASNLLEVVGGLDTLHDDNLANSIDSFLGDDTEAWCGLVDWAVQNGYLLEVYGLEYQNALRATDPQRKGRSYPIPDSHRRFFVKNQIKHSVVEAVKMRGKYQSLMTTIANGNTGPIASIGGTFNADVISHINNGNIERSDWRAELRQQLQDWKHSDETGILNVVDKVNKAVDSINRNLETQFPNSTNTQSFTQFVTNYVTKVITNSIERTGDNISSNVQDSAKQTRDLLEDTLFNPDYDGVNVRIKFPLRYQHTDEVNVHDEAVYNAMMDFINSRAFDMTNLFAHIDSLASNFTNDFSWLEWFDRWDPFATNVNWFISRYQDSDTTPIVLDPFENGFSEEEYHNLPWFSRVEALLFHIAQIGTNSITSVTEDDMRSLEDSQQEFDNMGTNFVAASVRVVGLFNGIRDFADSMARSFGNLAAKSTNGVVLLPAGSWIGEEPLILRVDTRVQDVCRIVSSCIWYLLAIILCWSVVSATWSKVCSFVRWLWSVMDI